MKAFVRTKYGSPNTLKLQEAEKPAPSDNEVLIKVKAVSVNPYDWHYMRGTPYFFRLMTGVFKPKHRILGADIAGVVESVGKGVSDYKPGDEVFGDCQLGGFAEYVCVIEDRLAKKPKNASFEEAASIPIAAMTALQGLRDTSEIKDGQHVLINGASGGVGTFAIQVAKAHGAKVTGVCSTRNLDLIKSVGADVAIDYTKESIASNNEKYDLVYDAYGNLTPEIIKKAMTPKGIATVIGFTKMNLMIKIAMLSKRTKNSDGQKFRTMTARPNHRDLDTLRLLVESGDVKPVIDRTYPFEKLPEAIRYIEKMHARGKVCVTVS